MGGPTGRYGRLKPPTNPTTDRAMDAAQRACNAALRRAQVEHDIAMRDAHQELNRASGVARAEFAATCARITSEAALAAALDEPKGATDARS